MLTELAQAAVTSQTLSSFVTLAGNSNIGRHTVAYNIEPELFKHAAELREYQTCHYSSKHDSQVLQRETGEHTMR